MKWFVPLICAGLFLASCSEGKKEDSSEEQSISPKPFVLNMQHFFTQSENFMSLPVWFEDSVIRSEKIFRLTRNIYHVSLNNVDESGSEDLDLREVREYYFDRAGHTDSIRIEYFYDDHKIGIVTFHYPDESDQFGYHEKVVRILKIPGDGGLTPQELPFILLGTRWSSGKFLSYKDQGRWTRYHFMLDKKNFGPLSVDSVIHPGPDDFVFLGKPEKPQKMYQVINKVHERNVHLYTYFEGNGPLRTYIRHDYPFEIRRNVVYNSGGICTGYIDSTLSDKTYLSRTKSIFKLNNRNLPEKLERVKQNQESKTSLVSVEKYVYERYKD